jgi:hypothetical protein
MAAMEAPSEMRRESSRALGGLALQQKAGQAYDEEALRHFLAIERKRAERFRRPFPVLLVDLKQQPGASAVFNPAVAYKLFSSLWCCLRDTDIVGWFRTDRVAGAVLTQISEGSQVEVARRVARRVTLALCSGLPMDIAANIRIRVYQVRPKLHR